MAHRVLDDWLQHHVRHEDVGQRRRRRDAHLQPVLEADLLDRQVQPQEFQLAPQRHFLRLDVVERHAKKIAEPPDHRFGLRGLLLLDQDDDGAERVEEKVRLQLHLEGAQLCRGELPRQLGGLHPQLEGFALAKRRVLLRPVDGLERDHGPIPDDTALNAERQHDAHASDEGRRRRGGEDAEQEEHRDFDHRRHDREDHAEAEMPCRGGGDAPLDWPPLAEPEEGRRERGADVHARHPADEHVLPRHGLAPIEPRHRILGDVEQPGDGPGEPDSRNQPDPLARPRRRHRFILPWVGPGRAGF